MSKAEINARRERRRRSQRLRRSILPPNYLGAPRPKRYANGHQEQHDVIPNRRTNNPQMIANNQTTFPMTGQSCHRNQESGSYSTTNQGLSYPNVGRSTLTTLGRYAPTNSIRAQGSSSNASSYIPPITTEGTNWYFFL